MDGARYQLGADIEDNFVLLGLKNLYAQPPIERKDDTRAIIVTSSRHYAYGGCGNHDEYGKLLSVNAFKRNHLTFLNRSRFARLLGASRGIHDLYQMK